MCWVNLAWLPDAHSLNFPHHQDSVKIKGMSTYCSIGSSMSCGEDICLSMIFHQCLCQCQEDFPSSFSPLVSPALFYSDPMFLLAVVQWLTCTHMFPLAVIQMTTIFWLWLRRSTKYITICCFHNYSWHLGQIAIMVGIVLIINHLPNEIP